MNLYDDMFTARKETFLKELDNNDERFLDEAWILFKVKEIIRSERKKRGNDGTIPDNYAQIDKSGCYYFFCIIQ